MLLELPRYSLSDEGSATAAMSYSRYVTKGVSRIETLLRMLMAPDSPAEELIEAYMDLVGDRSFSNFQKVLELKGIRKVDQNAILDGFIGKTGQRDDLSDSSFLTSLDMDVTSSALAMQTPLPFLSFANEGSSTPTGPSRYAGLTLGGLGGIGVASNAPSSGPAASASMMDYRVRSPPGGDVGAGAQKAFSDLKRFGSLLVGRRDASSTGSEPRR